MKHNFPDPTCTTTCWGQSPNNPRNASATLSRLTTPLPVRSVALGLTAGYGQPIDARVFSHYEWTIWLLNRYLRLCVAGYDGVSPTFRWTSIQLNAFASKTHIDGTNTPGTSAVVVGFGDYEGGELLVWENRWYGGNVGNAPLSSCSIGVDVHNMGLPV